MLVFELPEEGGGVVYGFDGVVVFEVVLCFVGVEELLVVGSALGGEAY